MDDLISREAALKVVCDTCQFVSCPDDDKCDEYEAMKNLPSADAVEVVRCKDCVWSIELKMDIRMFECLLSGLWNNGLYFCANGIPIEKREGDDE